MHGAAEPVILESDWSGDNQPVYLDGMLGWLHLDHAERKGDVAVLICPALSRDALDSHRFLRVLADDLALAGYPTMRFDYPDTGDSCRLADSGFTADDFWVACQESVQAAADFLLAASGAKRLIFCGLRIGATLAALAAESRDDVAGLILFAPVTRGQSYLRQLWVEAALQHGVSRPMQQGFEFQELYFSARAVQSLCATDLRERRMPRDLRIAIFVQSASNALTACERGWASQGAEIWSTDFAGLEVLLSHNVEGDTAPAEFAPLLEWIQRTIPYRPVAVRTSAAAGARQLHLPGCVETPLSFGKSGQLFGVLCRPEALAAEMAVIICGAGRNPHYGVGRSAVHLARSLAQAGFASLRIDLAGLGDSAGPPGKEQMLTGMFEDRRPEIRAAIDRLFQLGYRRIAFQGLCSGAYHGLHAALADTRIEMLLLVNLPLFNAANDEAAEVEMRAALPVTYYLARLTDKGTWSKIAGGRYNIKAILQGQVIWLAERIRRARLRADRHRDRADPAYFARSAFAGLGRRGVKTLFMFGPNEAGFHALERSFGKGGAEILDFPGIELLVLEQFDHLMSHRSTQQIAADRMLGFMDIRNRPRIGE